MAGVPDSASASFASGINSWHANAVSATTPKATNPAKRAGNPVTAVPTLEPTTAPRMMMNGIATIVAVLSDCGDPVHLFTATDKLIPRNDI